VNIAFYGTYARELLVVVVSQESHKIQSYNSLVTLYLIISNHNVNAVSSNASHRLTVLVGGNDQGTLERGTQDSSDGTKFASKLFILYIFLPIYSLRCLLPWPCKVI
jgi:hypothetical protein